MLYKLVVGSTRLQNSEGEFERYTSWDDPDSKGNILDLTPAQAKSLGRRVVPLAEAGEEAEVAPRRRGRPLPRK